MFAARRLGRVSLATIGAVGLYKGALLTANDDWDDLVYALTKKKTEMMALATQETVQQQRKPRVVVLGSGWGALSFIQKLDQDVVDLTIVSPRSFFFYTPLLAGTATGTVAHSSIVEPIRWYCQRTNHDGASFVQAECSSVDVKKKRITCKVTSAAATKPVPALQLDYDYLIIAVGAEPVTFGIPGVKEHTRFLKEVEDGIAIQRAILQKLELASTLMAASDNSSVHDKEISRLLSWVVVGGGPTGVELTAELTDFIKQEVERYFPALVPKIQLTLIEATDRLLGVFEKSLSASAQQMLAKRGTNVMCNTAVTRITPDTIEFKNSKGGSAGSIQYGTCIWAGGIARRPVVEAFAKSIDPYGRVQNSRYGLIVDSWMRVKGVADNSVFALGDCAVCGCAPTAQAAYQQGKFLGRIFRDSLGATKDSLPSMPAFKYSHKGSLAYTGGGKGVAELKSLWDAYPSTDGQVRVEGTGAFAIWRSLYFSRILSTSNQAQVLFDWTKAAIFGRDISSPYFEDDSSSSRKK